MNVVNILTKCGEGVSQEAVKDAMNYQMFASAAQATGNDACSECRRAFHAKMFLHYPSKTWCVVDSESITKMLKDKKKQDEAEVERLQDRIKELERSSKKKGQEMQNLTKDLKSLEQRLAEFRSEPMRFDTSELGKTQFVFCGDSCEAKWNTTLICHKCGSVDFVEAGGCPDPKALIKMASDLTIVARARKREADPDGVERARKRARPTEWTDEEKQAREDLENQEDVPWIFDKVCRVCRERMAPRMPRGGERFCPW